MRFSQLIPLSYRELSILRWLSYAFVPFLVLLVALSIATVLSYLIVHFYSDAVPLRQLISRVTQGLLVLSIFPFMSYLKINKQAFGYAPIRVFFKQLGQGFGIGFFVLIPVFIILYWQDVILIDKHQRFSLEILATTVAINFGLALLIAVVEESLFRGLLWTGLSKKLPAMLAVLISAIYFAGLHFLTVKTNLPTSTLTIWNGFTLWPEAFNNVISPRHYSALIALMMVGVFLGLLRSQFNMSLGLCIGCHCCWVWQIKICKKFFNTDFNSPNHYWVSSHYDGLIGPLVSLWLAIIIMVYFVYRYKTSNSRLVKN